MKVLLLIFNCILPMNIEEYTLKSAVGNVYSDKRQNIF